MQMMLRSIRTAVMVLASLMPWLANAFPMTPDPTGMWYDPNQPGWGLSVTQQGGTAFVVLFAYDANHDPEWLVASNVVDTGMFVNFLVGEAYAGPLYRTSAATYLQPGDTTALSATPVGTIQIAYVMPDNNLSVTYSVNGTTVNKTLAPQTWGSNASLLAGRIAGAININSVAGCVPPAPLQNVTRFNIESGVAPDSLFLSWGTGIDTECTLTGTYTQRGQLGALVGPVRCGPVPNPMADAGSMILEQLTVSSTGFSGALSYTSPLFTSGGFTGICAVGGSIGGVNTTSNLFAPPDPTGVWYDPANPGWGMTLVKQGDNTFAVLFLYDATHQPQWFVASNVVGTGQPTCDDPLNTACAASEISQGTLYRTTGPFLGSPGDFTALAATPVGTLQFHYGATVAPDAVPGMSLALQYVINGTTVTKTVQRQSWEIAQDLSGTYDGGFAQPAATANCTAQQVAALSPQTAPITVVQNGTSLQLSWGSGASACSASGTLLPRGQLENFSGRLACGAAGNGALTISNMSIGILGFSGAAFFTPDTGGCGYGAQVGAVKRSQ
jgi:hypothetical protein